MTLLFNGCNMEVSFVCCAEICTVLIALHRQAEKWDLGVHRFNQLKPGRFRKIKLQLRKAKLRVRQAAGGNQVGMVFPKCLEFYFEGKGQLFPCVPLSYYQPRCSHISDAAER